MERTHQFTAILSKEEDQYVALCPELDIASQGATIEEARANLVEALGLFLETASPQEVSGRLHKDVLVTRVEVRLPSLRRLSGAEVCRILEAHGFVLVRQRGSHAIMQRAVPGSTITVPVPMHKELKTGTLASIIRQSQAPRSAFEAR